MLPLPERGFARSVQSINVDENILADWIEASCLLLNEDISKSDIADILVEEQICDAEGQELARQIADMGFQEVERRGRHYGDPSPYRRLADRLEPRLAWQDHPVLSFFLVLSIARIYPTWAATIADHGVQGDLFERAVEGACPGLLPGWVSYRSGWSPTNAVSIPSIVDDLCPLLNTRGHPDLLEWIPDQAKDGGLDIVCVRSFADEREGLPTFLVQCASGANWRQKVTTPNPDEWQKYLDAAVSPSTAIAAPFVISTKDLRLAGLKGQIIVFDRTRLLSSLSDEHVSLDEELLFELINFVAAYRANLPI